MAKRIEVSLENQTLKAFDRATLAFAFDCISGAVGYHPTEKGDFKILWKDKDHFSKAYGVPMHYAMFFSNDGKAIHQFHVFPILFSIDRLLKKSVSDSLGSHGCVRLTEEHAKSIFAWTPIGTPVVIK